MKMCDNHWAKIRAEAERQGIAHLSTPEAAHAHASDAGYDPLIGVVMMVTQRVAMMGGIMALAGCPICEAQQHKHRMWKGEHGEGALVLVDNPLEIERHYIEGPMAAARARCIEMGLIAKPS